MEVILQSLDQEPSADVELAILSLLRVAVRAGYEE